MTTKTNNNFFQVSLIFFRCCPELQTVTSCLCLPSLAVTHYMDIFHIHPFVCFPPQHSLLFVAFLQGSTSNFQGSNRLIRVVWIELRRINSIWQIGYWDLSELISILVNNHWVTKAWNHFFLWRGEAEEIALR